MNIIMMIHAVSFILFIYLAARLVVPLPVHPLTKLIFGVILLVISQQHLIVRYFFGGLAAPNVPGWVLMFQGWSFLTLILLFALSFLYDAGLFVRWILRRFGKKRSPTAFSHGRRQAIMACLAVVPAAYAVKEAVHVPGVRRTEVRLASLPRELDGLGIVQISDLHVSQLLQAQWVRRVVEQINALNPDIVLFTGDAVDGTPERRAEGVAELRNIKSRHGVFGCLGNHEYYGNARAWIETFPDLGISLLMNEHRVLSIRGRQVCVAGVTDVVARNFGLPAPDSAAALAGVPADMVKIMLDHRPAAAAEHARNGADLVLSGHTHGGQIFGFNRIVAGFNEGYLYGWYNVSNMPMYVSSGTGLWAGFPVRLGVPSEIPYITLRSV